MIREGEERDEVQVLLEDIEGDTGLVRISKRKATGITEAS